MFVFGLARDRAGKKVKGSSHTLEKKKKIKSQLTPVAPDDPEYKDILTKMINRIGCHEDGEFCTSMPSEVTKL